MTQQDGGRAGGKTQGSLSTFLQAQDEAAGRKPSPTEAVLWGKCGHPHSLVLASFLPHFPLATKDMVANKSQLQNQSCSGFLTPSARPMGLVFSKDGR